MTIGQLYEKVRVVRTYQTKVIPGLLHTAGYMTGVLLGVRRERQVEPDDVSDAVTERLARQRCLRMQGKHFNFLLEETVLRYRPYGRERHREQLLHLLEVMRLPSVSLWIVPMDIDRQGVRPRESFDINTLAGSEQVMVELLSGLLTLTHPDDVAMYRTAWEDMLALAVLGDGARTLIHAAITALDATDDDG